MNESNTSKDAPDFPAERPASLHNDPEIAALLDFEPVVRKCRRHDGWTADNQRLFIVGLARTGSVDRAAQALGRTASGAYKVRDSADADGFAAAWDSALALHHRRNPRRSHGRPSRGELLAFSGRAAAPSAPEDPEAGERAKEEALDELLVKYMLKLEQEREARLAGRIVEADFYVRQLSWFEVALDLGGRGPELLKRLRRGDCHVGQIVATPMSALLDEVRRAVWEEEGGPERPPPPLLGHHDDEIATGPPLESQYCPARDGTLGQWRQRCAESEAIAAEAQRLWEEKARAEAKAWAERVEREATTEPVPADGGHEGDEDGTEDGDEDRGPRLRSLGP